MSPKPFASSADLAVKEQTLEVLADGVYALTAEGDPNVGAIEGEDFLVCFEAMATPVAARRWLARLREHTDKPVRYLVLSHYHAVRVLGASAFDAEVIVAHEKTRELVAERGQQDWASEFARMPRLCRAARLGARPHLAHAHVLRPAHDRPRRRPRRPRAAVLRPRAHRGRHRRLAAPQKVLFAGDLVEAQAALYTGDAFHREWASATLDTVAALGAEALVGGRGAVSRGRDAVDAAIAQTRHFLDVMIREVGAVQARGGTLKEAFEACHAALHERYGRWPIFEHCLPFDVSRLWDELSGIERPVIWTAERDREVWAALQS